MTPERWPEIDRLFHAALELRADARLSFVRTAANGDEDLRAEVESLLRHDRASAGFLELPALQQAARQLATDPNPPSADPHLPGYTILKELGEGGMGIVYLAEQTSSIHRQVALKLIRHGMDTRHVVARFAGERQTLALMRHPHIAAVFDAGTTADGRPYFAMEYVDGEPINEYCDRRQLPIGARLELFMDICAGVQHAHQKGVIHRDLKPSNVLVAEEDGEPRPKIIDFGVARAVERPMSGWTAMTEQGALVGTPEYMSPEQAALSPDIDTATDVYSLGVLLYELLVGALPFDPQALRAAGYDEMRRVIRESEPPRPSGRLTGLEQAAHANAAAAHRRTDAGRLTRQVKGDLDWITLKALEKDRRRRYATVASLAADVAHYLADEPVTARPQSVVYRVTKFTRRYRGAVAAVAAVILALVAGLAVSRTQWARAEQQWEIAERLRAQADTDRASAESAARDADAQRKTAVEERERAARAQIAQFHEASLANVAEREARFREYVATIGAADAELQLNQATAARARLTGVPYQLRGWEWSHLFLKTDTSAATLGVPVSCGGAAEAGPTPGTISDNVVSLVPDGSRIYFRRCASLTAWSGSGRGRDTRKTTGRVLAVGPGGSALVVDVVPTNAQPHWDLRLVDPVTNDEIARLPRSTVEPMCGAISPNGLRAAVGYRPQYSDRGEPLEDFFDVFDVKAGRRLTRLAPERPPQFDTRLRTGTSCMLAFSPDSSRLATSGSMVRVWRPDSAMKITGDDTQAGNVAQPIAWHPDNQRLAIGRLSGLVDILDTGGTPALEHLDPNGLIRVLPLPDFDRRVLVLDRRLAEVNAIAFSADGTRVLTGTDTNVGIWDVVDRKMTDMLSGHTGQVIGVAADESGRIVSADSSGIVKLWPRATTGAVRRLRGLAPSADFVLSGDGSIAALAQTDGRVSAWQLNDLKETMIRPGSGQLDVNKLARSLAMTPDGRTVLAGEPDLSATVRSWAWQSPTAGVPMPMKVAIPGCEPPPTTNNFSAVGMMVASNDGRNLAYRIGHCLIVKDLTTLDVRAVLHESATHAIFLPNGTIAVGTIPRTDSPKDAPNLARLFIWDWKINTIRAEADFAAVARKLDKASWRIAASADGSVIAVVGGNPAVVSLWTADLRRELGQLPVPPLTDRVALSADGQRLASIGGDSAARIWSVSRKQLLLVLNEEDRLKWGVAFTPDGRLIAGRSAGGLVIWNSRR